MVSPRGIRGVLACARLGQPGVEGGGEAAEMPPDGNRFVGEYGPVFGHRGAR